LLAALFLFQGIPVGAGQSSTVSGALKDATGKPLAYVRIAAVTPPETIDDRSTAAMSGLAETDEQGRYSIEGLPQGRYYIAAGRVDFPTYYPGTQDLSAAKILSIMPGVTVSGIDFAMDDSSTRVPQAEGLPVAIPRVTIPMQVSVRGGGKIPIFSNGKFAVLRITESSSSNWTTVALNTASLSLQSMAEFAFRLEGLPDGYAIESMKSGSIDLQTSPLKVPAGRAPPATIVIVLRATAPAPSTVGGVEISGRTGIKSARSLYLSGVPGTLYADNTFEFHGVPPGKHVLAGLDTVTPLGALLAVGDRNVTGIELLDEVSPVPFDIRSPREPEPLGAAVPGTLMPLASVRGTLREEVARKPIADTEIKITGYAKTETFVIDANGHFEIPRLFPGTYKVEVQVFGHEQLLHTLTVGTENITLDLTSRRLY
jgi:hypothetical protein